jgi:hypothetical protein
MRNAISNLLSPKKTITNSYNESSSVNVNEPDRRSSFSSAASNLSFSALRGRSPFLEEKESFDEENFLIDLDDISEPLPSIKRNLRMSDFEDCVMYAEGTNAVLYKARLGSKEVILKMMKPEATNCKGVLHEFDIEEKILERCDHPNIVKFYGSGWDPRKFMVLEFLEEGTVAVVDFSPIDLKRYPLSIKDLYLFFLVFRYFGRFITTDYKTKEGSRW